MSTPGTSEWAQEHWGAPCTQELTTVEFGRGKQVTVAKVAVRHFRRLNRILKKHAREFWNTIEDFQDDWGFACRPVRGTTNVWSQHAFGLAVDLNATTNVQGMPYKDSPIWKKARKAIYKWESEGGIWGGRFGNPDPMHFSSGLTRGQTKARYFADGRRKPWFYKRRKP